MLYREVTSSIQPHIILPTYIYFIEYFTLYSVYIFYRDYQSPIYLVLLRQIAKHAVAVTVGRGKTSYEIFSSDCDVMVKALLLFFSHRRILDSSSLPRCADSWCASPQPRPLA